MTYEPWSWEDDWWLERGRRFFASPWPAEVTDNRLCSVSVEAVADAMRTGEDAPGRALADARLALDAALDADWLPLAAVQGRRRRRRQPVRNSYKFAPRCEPT